MIITSPKSQLQQQQQQQNAAYKLELGAPPSMRMLVDCKSCLLASQLLRNTPSRASH
jgi:hypothetical protein